MNRYLYSQEYRVLPFVFAPVPILNEEVSLIFGPQMSADDQQHLIKVISRRVKNAEHRLPIATDVLRYSGKMIVATTVTTDAQEAVSGRAGLKFTYGAIVDMSAYQKCPTTCSSMMTELIETYLAQEFEVEFSIDGVKKIVEILQSPPPQLSDGYVVDRERADKFLTEVEARFGQYQPSLSPWTMLSNRIKILRLTGRRRPMSQASLTDTYDTWRELDQRILGPRHQARRIGADRGEEFTRPSQPVRDGKRDQKPQPLLPGEVLLAAFQRAISSISSVSYLAVALLIAWLLAQNLFLSITDTNNLAFVVVYSIGSLISFLVSLQLTERYLFLWALWRHINLPLADNVEALPKSVLMSPARMIIISLLTMVSLVVVISIMLLSLNGLLTLITWQNLPPLPS